MIQAESNKTTNATLDLLNKAAAAVWDATDDCASSEEVQNFFVNHDFMGDVSFSYLDPIDHSIITQLDGVFAEEM